MNWSYVQKYGVVTILLGEIISLHAHMVITQSKLKQPSTNKIDARKTMLLMVIENVDRFKTKAKEIVCLMSTIVDGSEFCLYDTMCALKHDVPNIPHMDFDAILLYRQILSQFPVVLQNMTLYERILDRKGLYQEMYNFQKIFEKLIRTLDHALNFFKDGSGDSFSAPDIFYPFPSNDRCAIAGNYGKDKQAFRAMKSIWLFASFMRIHLHHRCSPYYMHFKNIYEM